MDASHDACRRLFRAAILAAAIVPAVRAADDVVVDDDAAPPAAAGVPFNGPLNGRVIVMPGMRLWVGGQGHVHVQGDLGVPGVAEAAGTQRQPYLGVVTGPVAAAVRAQLDLPEGVGLSVEAVAAGSPAEKAGVRQFDVIRKIDDQEIVSPEQVTALVRKAGCGTTVALTLVRGGREEVLEAVLQERAVAANPEDLGIMDGVPGVVHLEQFLRPGLPANGLGPRLQAEIERQVAEAVARAAGGGALRPGLAPGMVPGQPNMRAQMLTIGPDAQSTMVARDDRGTVEIRAAGGKKTVTVKDPAGAEVYAGPLDSAEDLAQVPEEYRDWVGEVDGSQPVIRPMIPEAEGPEGQHDSEAAEAAGSTT